MGGGMPNKSQITAQLEVLRQADPEKAKKQKKKKDLNLEPLAVKATPPPPTTPTHGDPRVCMCASNGWGWRVGEG